MGIETIDSTGEQIGAVEDGGYEKVVRQAIHAAETGTNTHTDGGWGASIVGRHEVADTTGISYAGEQPVKPDSPPAGFKPFPTMP